MKKLLSILLVLLLLTGCAAVPAETPTTTGTSTTAPTETATEPAEPKEVLQVHFIDVGQADCALIELGDFTMLIDGGNKADSSLVVSYLEQQGVSELDVVVCTHAHEDHVGGLPGVLAVYPTGAVYAPTKTYSSNIFDDFVYYTDQQGLEIVIPSPGDTIEAEGLTITVLGPVDSYSETNNTSIVLRIDYENTSFLFTGDMETSAEGDMLDYWGEDFDWNVDVLKVGHHGSDTSTSYRFLNAVMPTHAVISVGAGNSYGHPCEVPLSRLEDADCIIYRTDLLGTVIATSDGDTVTVTWGNQQAEPEIPVTEATEPTETTEATESTEQTEATKQTDPTESTGESQVQYIGNKNSKKFHLPTCSSLPAEKNQVFFDSYEEAVAAGYTPCSKCLK